jgi:Uma2 family endonuclease
MARNRPFLDDLEHVMGVPRALVGHYRRIDGARHLGEALDAFNRLLEIGDGCPRHAAEGADRLGGRRIALVGAVGTIRRDPYSRETRNVLAAFEILSPSTEERDLRWKRMAYPTLPPLTHYVVIAQDGVDIVVFARDAGFAERHLRSLGDSLEFASPGISFPLSEIYRDTGLE